MNTYTAVLVSFFTALVCVPVVKRIAVRWDIIAHPKDDRWNSKHVPLLGGVAIYAATVLAFSLVGQADRHSIIIVSAGTAVFVLGIVDDLRHLSPPVKLIVEIAVSSLVIAAGLKLDITGNYAVDTVITIVWIVGLTNAFNLLDNMDGLAAGIAGITGVVVSLCLFGSTSTPTAVLLASLIGAALGFLVYNFTPASIFMGDSGSLFVGFMLSGIVLVPEIKFPGQILQIVSIPVLIFLIPIFDTSVAVLTRKLSGLDAMKGGKDHTSHRLVKIGLSERQAVLVLYGIGALSGLLAYLGRHMPVYVYIELIFLFSIVIVFLGVYLSRIKVRETGKGEKGVISIIVNVTYKRRIFEILLDLAIIFISLYGAYLLRFEGPTFRPNVVTLFRALPLVLSIQIVSFAVVGIYRGVWKYTGTHDVWTIIKGIVMGVGLSMVAILLIWRFADYSRTVFIIYGAILLILMTLSRYLYRSFDYLFRKGNGPTSRRVLIYGAGDSGMFAVSEILNNGNLGLTPVCFIDDDTMKHGRSINGYPVVAGIESIEDVIRGRDIDEVIVSTPRIPEDRIIKVRRVCKRSNTALRRFSLSFEDYDAVPK